MNDIPVPQELASRLLFPFRFWLPANCDPTKDAFDPGIVEALAEHTLVNHDGETLCAWESLRLEELQHEHQEIYLEEMFPHVQDFLFKRSGAASGRFFRMPAETWNHLFNGEFVLWPRGRANADLDTTERYVISKIAGVELFLFGFGIGILSFSIYCGGNRGIASLESVRRLLYSISQRRKFLAPTLSRFHPRDDPQKWADLPPETRDKVPQLPPNDAPLRGRLGVLGGEFGLEELFRSLVEPLRDPQHTGGYQDDHHTQFTHYTVLRFGNDIDFAREADRDGLLPELSALAQLEEPGHAGASALDIPVPYRVLNRKHLSAAGSQGSAHFVADQYPPGEGEGTFDTARLGVMRDKYFMGWILPVVQDQFLHRAGRECAKVVEKMTEKPEQSQDALSALRKEVLEFDVFCRVTKFSQREALNRFYDLACEGLKVAEKFDDIATETREMDAYYQARHQREVLDEQNRLQVKVEWVEIFLVAAYSVYLIHYLGKNLGFEPKFIGWWILGGSSFASAFAAWLLEPWRHGPSKANIFRTWPIVLATILMLIGLYLGFGLFAYSNGH